MRAHPTLGTLRKTYDSRNPSQSVVVICVDLYPSLSIPVSISPYQYIYIHISMLAHPTLGVQRTDDSRKAFVVVVTEA